MKRVSITLALIVGMIFFFTGYDLPQIEQQKPQEDKAYIQNSEDLPVSEVGGQLILRIESSKKWKVKMPRNMRKWVQTDQRLKGKGNGVITFFVQPNDSSRERSGELTVFLKNNRSKITIQQRGKLSPVEPTPIPVTRLELPLLSTDKNHKYIEYTVSLKGKTIVNYSQEFDLKEKHSRWVAFRFDAETSEKKERRSDAWECDPNLPQDVCIGGTFPDGTDRGHLVASSDRAYCKEANMQTFYYSNISPQKGYFNQGIWQKLENKVQEWGRNRSNCDTLYVVKGGTIYNGDILGYMSPRNNKSLSVPVPKYYFMALLKIKDGRYYSIGFLMKHEKIPVSNRLGLYTITIDELEQRTGYDFFHALPDEKETEVESKIDVSYWDGL
ncbi:MAG: DNA/RNA non-specific endonuclease [Porphyromonas sp.]|nr:DNA/RNA non-specific endonuclease [Porphyromonas sp.]